VFLQYLGKQFKTKKVKFYQFSCDSTVSFGQSNVKSAHLVHRKHSASSDSAQSKINFKLSQIFSPLMAIEDGKVGWVHTTQAKQQMVWRDVPLFGPKWSINLVVLCLINIGSVVKTFCF